MPDSAAARFQNDPASRIRDAVTAIEVRLTWLRRDIHARPEPASEENRTAGPVAAELRRPGIAHRGGIGRTGAVGTIAGGRPGPTLAIRADMDALPTHEEMRLSYASTARGRMHACSHDLHTATLLGIAAPLRDTAPEIAGTVRLLLKPAEATLEGAAAMIAEAAPPRPARALDASHRVRCGLNDRRGVPPVADAERIPEPAIGALRRQFGAADSSELATRLPAFLHVGLGAPVLTRIALELLA